MTKLGRRCYGPWVRPVPDGMDGTIEVGNRDYWTGVDRAPKLLVRCPAGDFVAGGKVKLRRTALARTPQAQGWISDCGRLVESVCSFL